MKNYSLRYFLLFTLFLLAFNQKIFAGAEGLKASTDTLNFGHSEIEKTIYLTNNSSTSLNWSVGTSVPWIKIDPPEGVGTINGHEGTAPNAPYLHSFMWPQLSQPWYVIGPESIGIDHGGNIYVVDSGLTTTVKKFNKYEEFLFELPFGTPNQPGFLNYPRHIAFDSHNNFYVTAGFSVKKFDPNGHFIAEIQMVINGQVQSYHPYDIAIDSSDDIYITDELQFCVHKFNKDGNYLKSWGRRGMADGEFDSFSGKLGILADSHNNIYVADNHYYRIQKFDSEGNFIKKWGFNRDDYNIYADYPQYAEEFASDSQDVIYIGHEDSGFLGKFDTQGNKIAYSHGEPKRWFDEFVEFGGLADTAIAANGNIYLSAGDRKIVKFNPAGELLEELKSHSKEDGKFYWPVGTAMDHQGNLYIRDENNRLQIFDPSGTLLMKWDWSDKNYPFDPLSGSTIVIDSQKNVFIRQDSFILKLNSQGQFLALWQKPELNGIARLAIDGHDNLYVFSNPTTLTLINQSGDNIKEISVKNSFHLPTDFLVDQQNNIYVAYNNGDIIEFDDAGHILHQFKYDPSNESSPYISWQITVDDQGNLYAVAAGYTGEREIRKFDSQGQILTTWGRIGTEAGGFVFIDGIAAGPNHQIYVVEHGNNRVQVFSQTTIPLRISIDRTKLSPGDNFGKLTFYNETDNSQTPIEIAVNAYDDRPLPDLTPPTVTITSPRNNSIVIRNTTVPINATASDNVGVTKVEFYVNNALVCTDTTAPYSCGWNVPKKVNTQFNLQAKAYDAKGNVGVSKINVTSRNKVKRSTTPKVLSITPVKALP